MNTKLKLAIFFALMLFIGGISIITRLYFYDKTLTNYFVQSQNILKNLGELRKEEYKLNYFVLKSTFYLYENNDKVIKEIRYIDSVIKKLNGNYYFKKYFPKTYKSFEYYKKYFSEKKSYIYRFYIYNSLIKNATIYLEKVLVYSTNLFSDNPLFLKKEIESINNVFLVKNSFDEMFLENIDIGYFKSVHFKDKEKEKIKNVLVENLLLFKNNFPKYSKYLDSIQYSKTLEAFKNIYKFFFKEKKEKIKGLNKTFYFIMVVLLGGMILTFILLVFLLQEHTALQKSFITDKLTGLGNREKLNLDLKKYKSPTLYLLNIDKFKHINDIYGIEIGDEILKKVAEVLKNNFDCANKNVYRLGSDDFAILCDGELDYKKIVEYFENHSLVVKGREFNIRVSLGISKEFPLIETADMALKEVKKDSKLKYLIYHKDSKIKEKYKANLEKSKFLENAIKNDLIIPVYQPIVENETKTICKYEVLARIKDSDKLISIFPYLEVAKENKIYKEITKIIYKKAYETFKNNDLAFSLNLSIDDILEEETIELIEKLTDDKNFASRCTFELLESEAIEDYEIVKSFIKKMKKKGVSFAIDDFGSGYSNFEQVINLEIDYLKIDGSLIRKLKDNPHTKVIVKTINSFAKEIGLKSIAEFVSDEEIYKIAKEIGIDCSQGYYFSPPIENI